MSDQVQFDSTTFNASDVLTTAEIVHRASRPPDFEAESRALVALVRGLADSPETVLQKLVEAALELCRADSAGISIAEKVGDQAVFRWHATAGAFARYVGGTMPRDHSPCGTVLDRNATLLMTDPARHYPDIARVPPGIAEVLLVPFHRGDVPVGTVWVIAHTAARKFDAEDARLMQSLSRFASAAVQALATARDARRAEAELRLALDIARLGTWTWAPATDEVTADARCREICGLDPGAALTLGDVLPRVHADDRPRVEAALRAALRPGGNGLYAEEFRFAHAGGAVRWVISRGRTQLGGQGDERSPAVMIGTVLDITARKQAEEALRDADRRKDEFLAMLGHELRNPLAPLRGVMETLRRQRLAGPALERAYAMMDRQVAHLGRLVDDLLDVSRITRGVVELRKEPVSLAEVAERAVEMVTPAVEGRGHELMLALPQTPLRVEGDATRLTQVVFNLLNNAAKYTDPGGKIWLTLEGEGGQAVVRVRDNGSGMPPDLVPKVFGLFTQGTRSLDRSQGGLGLGLTLVKRLAEMHGGSAEARSEGPGRGSEFVMRLPALPAGAEKPPARPLGPPPASVQVDRALVVDDVPDIAESFAWMLEGLAREVKMAHSGAAAVELARDFRPQLVLCDLGMPGMDGYETCRQLRRLPGLERTVIAAISGYGGEEDRRKSQGAGFDRHLIKPIGRATLEELVNSAGAKK